MKIKLVLFITITIFLLSCAQGSDNLKNLSSLLPQKGEIQNWSPSDTAQIYVGDDLFTFINGGADIYHEYGFNRVITQEFVSSDNQHSINVEIYEMNDPASAFGIYTFKIGNKGKKLSIGQDALLQNYYLNFWKWKYLIILTGFDSEKPTTDGIISLAESIDTKIKKTGPKPELIQLLPKENLPEENFPNLQLKYLKGNLALFNHYQFDTENIFGLKEGVIGNYNDFQLIIVKYKNAPESKKWYNNALNKIKDNSYFKQLTPSEVSFSVLDRDEKFLTVQPVQNYILITLGLNRSRAEYFVENIRQKITSPDN